MVIDESTQLEKVKASMYQRRLIKIEISLLRLITTFLLFLKNPSLLLLLILRLIFILSFEIQIFNNRFFMILYLFIFVICFDTYMQECRD